MNLAIVLPTKEDIEIYNVSLERKMYARGVFMDCEKMIRDLEYYNGR